MRHTATGLVAVLCLSLGVLSGQAEDNTPPKGFKALFNGKDLSGWKADDKAKEHWTVEEGVLVYDGKGRSLATEENFRNFVLHVDWKVNRMGADSGIFLRGRPQVQIWTRDEGSGGLWNDKVKALKNADNPIGEWNHFEITVEQGRITVMLNGEKVVDGYEKKWRKEEGPVMLQHHGAPLWFKNIYIKALPD